MQCFVSVNSTAELTLNGCGVVQTAAPELQLKECAPYYNSLKSRSWRHFYTVIRELLARAVEVAPQQLFALAQMLPNIFWSRTDYISGAYATKWSQFRALVCDLKFIVLIKP